MALRLILSRILIVLAALPVSVTFHLSAQTTLTGDHRITGDLTVDQDLTVTGSQSIQGQLNVESPAWLISNDTYFGVLSDDPDAPGLRISYTDRPDFPFVRWIQMRHAFPGYWTWEYTDMTGAPKPQMVLSGEEGNSLQIYPSGQTVPTIVLAGDSQMPSQFQGSVQFWGTDNTMYNQTLTGPGSVLTRGLADTRYVPFSAGSQPILIGGPFFGFGEAVEAGGEFSASFGSGARAPGDGAFAAGSNVIASGQNSIALGDASTASGGASVSLGAANEAAGTFGIAMGEANLAWGEASIAMGAGSSATGDHSVAMGFGNSATGENSVAIGRVSISTGANSTAIGSQTIAQGFNQFVTGRYNVPQGNPSQWIATDDLFVVGNGLSDTNRANAFVIKKNGEAGFQGPVRVPPSGDLSMGAFTSGVLPPAPPQP
jgi:hypothetical protein